MAKLTWRTTRFASLFIEFLQASRPDCTPRHTSQAIVDHIVKLK